MIRNFSDHAANERTFLAWVRTGVSVMAFGFLVETFDLFLRFSRASSCALAVRTARGTGLGSRFDLALAALLVLLGCALLGYLLFNLLAPR